MPVPQLSTKHGSPAHFEPADHLDYFRTTGLAPAGPAPRGVILCYQRSLLQQIIATEAPEAQPCVLGKLYRLPASDGELAVAAGFGIGAPAAAMMLELIIAMGTKAFISIGTAGALAPGLAVGALSVCTGAVRDEGVSHHYLAQQSARVPPNTALTHRFAGALAAAGSAPALGPTWTTDAPFRETRAEIAHYQAMGVLTVEMEAAALFAVAAVRQVTIAAGFVVSDTLNGHTWTPRFRAEETAAGLYTLYGAAKVALAAHTS